MKDKLRVEDFNQDRYHMMTPNDTVYRPDRTVDAMNPPSQERPRVMISHGTQAQSPVMNIDVNEDGQPRQRRFLGNRFNQQRGGYQKSEINSLLSSSRNFKVDQ